MVCYNTRYLLHHPVLVSTIDSVRLAIKQNVIVVWYEDLHKAKLIVMLHLNVVAVEILF